MSPSHLCQASSQANSVREILSRVNRTRILTGQQGSNFLENRQPEQVLGLISRRGRFYITPLSKARRGFLRHPEQLLETLGFRV